MQVWFVRHGEAVPHEAKPDSERELTPRGERQATLVGRGLASLGLELAACYTSPKVRALETARLAAEELGVEVQEADSLAGDFDRADLEDLLHAHDKDARVVLVGHEPDFSQLIHDLTGARVDLKKGGVAAVRLEGSKRELMVLLRPKDLESLSS